MDTLESQLLIIVLAMISFVSLISLLYPYLVWRDRLDTRLRAPWGFYDLESIYGQEQHEIVDKLVRLVREREGKAGIKLSPEARKMISLPIIELAREMEDIDWEDTTKSIGSLLEEMKTERSGGESTAQQRANTRSLIRAFSRKYCNIPPFCDRTKGARERKDE